MPAFSGTFSGKFTKNTDFTLTDQPNHIMSLAEVQGTQKSADQNWNNATVTYWGVTDLLAGQGTQRGYYVNVHADGEREFGTFEGKAAMKGTEGTVEGTWKITDGTGKYKGAKGNGKFKTRTTPSNGVECSWEGAYELVAAARV
jgi:hypothetical protein